MKRLDNRGMALSGMLYTILVLFLALLFGILTLVSSGRFTLDKLKKEVYSTINGESAQLVTYTEDTKTILTINSPVKIGKYFIAKSTDYVDEDTITYTEVEPVTKLVIEYEPEKNGTYVIYTLDAQGRKSKFTFAVENIIIMYKNGDSVYFDPEYYEACSEASYNEDLLDYSSAGNPNGQKTGCMKWYVFNDDGGSEVNMILDHNVVQRAYYNDAEDKNTASTILSQIPSDWDSDLNARLLSKDDLKGILGMDDIPNDIIYLASKSTTQASSVDYGWLNDNLANCSSSNCNHQDNSIFSFAGSSKTSAGYYIGFVSTSNNYHVRTINTDQSINRERAKNSNTQTGLRPVITVDRRALEYDGKALKN